MSVDDMDSARRRRLIEWAVAGTTAAAAFGSLAPALAEVYKTPGREVVVASAGESEWGYIVVSNGGFAEGYYVGLSNGGHAQGGYLAVSNGGNAYSWTGGSVATTGCARGPSNWIGGISLTGCAEGGHLGISGTGPVGGNTWFGVSGTNCASAFFVAVSGLGCDAIADVAVSGTGDAYGHNGLDLPYPAPVVPGAAVSGTGNASGGALAVAPDGEASSSPMTIWTPLGTPVLDAGAAVSGTGDADANGGLLAVSGQGRARGGRVNFGWDGTE